MQSTSCVMYLNCENSKQDKSHTAMPWSPFNHSLPKQLFLYGKLLASSTAHSSGLEIIINLT